MTSVDEKCYRTVNCARDSRVTSEIFHEVRQIIRFVEHLMKFWPRCGLEIGCFGYRLCCITSCRPSRSHAVATYRLHALASDVCAVCSVGRWSCSAAAIASGSIAVHVLQHQRRSRYVAPIGKAAWSRRPWGLSISKICPPRAGTEPDGPILADLLREGLIVLVLDLQNQPKAVVKQLATTLAVWNTIKQQLAQ